MSAHQDSLGTVISIHRTIEAAERYRAPGLPTIIVKLDKRYSRGDHPHPQEMSND